MLIDPKLTFSIQVAHLVSCDLRSINDNNSVVIAIYIVGNPPVLEVCIVVVLCITLQFNTACIINIGQLKWYTVLKHRFFFMFSFKTMSIIVPHYFTH